MSRLSPDSALFNQSKEFSQKVCLYLLLLTPDKSLKARVAVNKQIQKNLNLSRGKLGDHCRAAAKAYYDEFDPEFKVGNWYIPTGDRYKTLYRLTCIIANREIFFRLMERAGDLDRVNEFCRSNGLLVGMPMMPYVFLMPALPEVPVSPLTAPEDQSSGQEEERGEDESPVQDLSDIPLDDIGEGFDGHVDVDVQEPAQSTPASSPMQQLKEWLKDLGTSPGVSVSVQVVVHVDEIE